MTVYIIDRVNNNSSVSVTDVRKLSAALSYI